ncbi:MAG: hypothetical protein F6J93_09160 [Oscillatoria sp. SIO1A7]|nr:hypothetical protein [Oscillatoria sp. SIO1A7]
MNKLAKCCPEAVWEKRLRGNLAAIAEIRTDSLNDLEIMGADFRHLGVVVASVERNYQALLEQNQQMRDLLIGMVDECYCWQGNRCDRCARILQVLADSNCRSF